MQEEENSMNFELEPEPHHRVLHHRLNDAFTPTYLTILSIIQAVALADLATVVAAEYRQFTVVQWLLALLTFSVLIMVWNAYTIQGTIWRWIPDIRDAAMPFVVGALELFLNHAITLGISFWLLGLAAITAMGAVGTWYMHWRARTEAGNDQLLEYLKRHHLVFALYYTGGAAFMLLLAWANHVGSWEAAEGGRGVLAVGTALIVGVCLSGAVIISHLYWRKAIVYARTGLLKLKKDKVQRPTSSWVTSPPQETKGEAAMQRVLRYNERRLRADVYNQAALNGSLSKINTLGLPLLSVDKVEREETPHRTSDVEHQSDSQVEC
jgi:hypothetical protein